MVVTFQQAYDAARRRHAAHWASFRPRDIVSAIYEEMRRLDAEASSEPLAITEIRNAMADRVSSLAYQERR